MADETPDERDMRRGAAFRSVVIAAMVVSYGWFLHQPSASFKQSFLVAAALQLALIALKRLVPADRLPQALYVYETIADGITVLLFALGVIGGIAYRPMEM